MNAPEPDAPLDFELILPPDAAGKRFDVAVAAAVPRLSRSYAGRLLKEGAIQIDGKAVKQSHAAKGGERVHVTLPEPEEIEARPENIPLSILFEDASIIVVNKPPGMVTHPSSGHTSGALVNALLFHCKDLSSINGKIRPGIVHRLDKDTSGCIVAAKNDTAHRGLAAQFADRTVTKQYIALSHGNPLTAEFICEGRIGRHPAARTEMTIMRGADEGREAYTHFSVLERFAPRYFLVEAHPRTGRTHQIRVHLAKSGYPILADPLYGREAELPELGLRRHALHARTLAFQHPLSAEKLSFDAPIPDDIETALRTLRG
jgi:23S rRNA pseudouridine1911/1915/1917 synthase